METAAAWAMFCPIDEIQFGEVHDPQPDEWTLEADDEWAAAAVLTEEAFQTAVVNEWGDEVKDPALESDEVDCASHLPTPVGKAMSPEALARAAPGRNLFVDADDDASSIASSEEGLPSPVMKATAVDFVSTRRLDCDGDVVDDDIASICSQQDQLITPMAKATSVILLAEKNHADDIDDAASAISSEAGVMPSPWAREAAESVAMLSLHDDVDDAASALSSEAGGMPSPFAREAAESVAMLSLHDDFDDAASALSSEADMDGDLVHAPEASDIVKAEVEGSVALDSNRSTATAEEEPTALEATETTEGTEDAMLDHITQVPDSTESSLAFSDCSAKEEYQQDVESNADDSMSYSPDKEDALSFDGDGDYMQEDEGLQSEALRLVRCATSMARESLDPSPAPPAKHFPEPSDYTGTVDVNEDGEVDTVAAEADRLHEEILRIGKALPDCQRREIESCQAFPLAVQPPASKWLYRSPTSEPKVLSPPQPTADDWLYSQTMFSEGNMSVNDVLAMVDTPSVTPMVMEMDAPKCGGSKMERSSSTPSTQGGRPTRTKHRVINAPTRSNSTSALGAAPAASSSAMDMDLCSSARSFSKRSSSTGALRAPDGYMRQSPSSSKMAALPGAPSKLNPLRTKGAPLPQQQGPMTQGSLAWSMRNARKSSMSSLRYGAGGYGGYGGYGSGGYNF